MSLTGKRILITRTRHQASALASQLEALGAIPILIPTIEIAAPTSFAALDAALVRLRSSSRDHDSYSDRDSYSNIDWLVFTSQNAVEAFHHRWQHFGDSKIRAPHSSQLTRVPGEETLIGWRSDGRRLPRVAAIGPATASALEAIGLTVDLLPPQYIAESLAEALLPEAPGKSFLLIRAEQARDVLPEALTATGATVTIAPAYRNQLPPNSIAALRHLFSSTPPDAITFTSASTATNFFTLLEAANITLPIDTTLASIGPITSQTLRDLGYPPQIEAAESTIPALVAALTMHYA